MARSKSRKRLTPTVATHSRGAVPNALTETVETVAKTLWGEARGEPELGKVAVAAVIVNRARIAEARGGYWWGDDIVGVCRKPAQFSCWNENDPNADKIAALDGEDPVYRDCLRLARRAVNGQLSDPTDGATHYHALGVNPFWARGQKPTARIGNHLFYRLDG